jgi:hypothetical protein
VRKEELKEFCNVVTDECDVHDYCRFFDALFDCDGWDVSDVLGDCDILIDCDVLVPPGIDPSG